jgi:hypothetical protein
VETRELEVCGALRELLGSDLFGRGEGRKQGRSEGEPRSVTIL